MNERELFIAALQQPDPARREAALVEACAGDVDLRRRVDALLAAFGQAGSFLQQPPPELGPTLDRQTVDRPAEHAGTAIGPYKLIEPIGEGGMGTVWMAQQTAPVKRLVAVKLIKAGMDSQQVIARFEAERQALALMDHVNIARVLDAGTTSSGRPYFVMDLVRGMPITRYCDEHHLTPRQRLELFVPVCQAVQHAHQKGIIHRDLKPTNVLVALYDGQPVPKIIDFGVAKATGQSLTDKTLVTGFGTIVGTLEYMSPEQAEQNQLDIDTRSDIYSLGVLLYELLAGSPPFSRQELEHAGMLEMLRVIREEEPSKPSTKLSTADGLPTLAANRGTEPAKLAKLVRGELDWIVMKALEKDRNRRYETANGFGLDVQRYLADEQVLACPPAAAYRLRKFVRRNRAVLATTTIVAAALVLGSAVSVWQAVRATKARRDAEIARDGESQQRIVAQRQSALARQNEAEAQLQRREAEANFGQALQAVNEYLSQVTDSELLSVPGLQPLREDLLKAALKFYGEFTQARSGEATLVQHLASAHHRLAMIQSELGNEAAARAANRESVRLYEQLRGQGRTGLDLKVGLAQAYFFGGRYDDTIGLCTAALQEEPQHTELRSLLAETYNTQGNALSERNEWAASLKLQRQAFELREGLVRDYPSDYRYLTQLSGTLNNIGVLLVRQGRGEEGLAMYERAVGYAAQAYELAPHSMVAGKYLYIQLSNAASGQAQAGRQADALRSYERLVAVGRKRAFENPAIGALRGQLCKAYLALGRYQKECGDDAGAGLQFRLAREALEQLPRETPDQLFELATVYAVLAAPPTASAPVDDAAERLRNSDLAVATLQKAVDAGYQNAKVLAQNKDLEGLRSRGDFQAIRATVEKIAEAARLAGTRGDPTAQLASSTRAAELLKSLAAAQPGQARHRSTLAATLHSIGVVQTGLKQFADAEKSLDEALRIQQALLAEPGGRTLHLLDLLQTRAALGQLYLASDRPQAAHRLWQEVLAQCRLALDEDPPNETLRSGVAGVRWSIAQRYGEIGLWKLACQPVDESLQSGQLYQPAWDCRGIHLLAATGRLDEHRRFCRMVADQWGQADPALVVWATTMNPRPDMDPKRLLELAQGVIDSSTDEQTRFQAATAWYWAGEYERAWELMLPFRTKISSGGSAYLHWLALVCHKLGRQEEAARYFEQAEARYRKFAEQCLRSPEQSAVQTGHGGYWWAWAEDQALRRLAWNELRPEVQRPDPWQHLIEARGYRLIGEQDKSAAEQALADSEISNDPQVWMARARLAEESNGRDGSAEVAWLRAVESAGDHPLPWIQRGRWYAQRGERGKAEADFAKAASLTPSELNKFLEAGWWVVGPYPSNLDEFCPPQRDPDPSRPVHIVDSKGLSVKPVAWQQAAVDNLGAIQRPDALKGAASVYALALVYSPDDRTALARVGGTTGVRVWCNGQLVFGTQALSAYNIGRRRVPLALHRGLNRILLRFEKQPVSFTLGDAPMDRFLRTAEAGLWHEAAAIAFQQVPRSQLYDKDFLFEHALAVQLALLSGDREVLEREGDLLLKRSLAPTEELGDWGPIRSASALSLVDNPIARAHYAELQSSLQERLPRKGDIYKEQRNLQVLAELALLQGQTDVAAELMNRPEGAFEPKWRLPLWAVLRHQQGQAAEARVHLEGALQQAAKDDLKDYWPLKGWFFLKLRDAERQIRGSTQRTDDLLASQRQAALARWKPDALAVNAFDHFVATYGSDGKVQEPTYPCLARARWLAGQERWDEAATDFTAALNLKRGDIGLLMARARFYAQRGQVELALNDFAAALARAAEAGDESYARGLEVGRELAEHDAVFAKAIERWPSDYRLWLGRSVHHADRGRWKEAAADNAKAAWPGQFYVIRTMERACLQHLAGDREGYRKTCQELLAKSPRASDQLTFQVRRGILIVCGIAPEGGALAPDLVERAEPLKDEKQSEPWVHLGTALAFYRAGRFDEARLCCEEALPPALPLDRRLTLDCLRAMCLHQLGRQPEAQALLAAVKTCCAPPDAAQRLALSKNGGPEQTFRLVRYTLFEQARQLIAPDQP